MFALFASCADCAAICSCCLVASCCFFFSISFFSVVTCLGVTTFHNHQTTQGTAAGFIELGNFTGAAAFCVTTLPRACFIQGLICGQNHNIAIVVYIN